MLRVQGQTQLRSETLFLKYKNLKVCLLKAWTGWAHGLQVGCLSAMCETSKIPKTMKTKTETKTCADLNKLF